MKVARQVFLAAISMSLVILPAAGHAASKKSWDGVWEGLWGGTATTSVTIEGGKVVRYEYRFGPQPIKQSAVSGDTVTFGNSTYSVVITRTSDTTATAKYHSDRLGDATAELTRR